ncbi:MAG: hypothetical protein AB7E72_00200 [Lysobacterales bacterium]
MHATSVPGCNLHQRRRRLALIISALALAACATAQDRARYAAREAPPRPFRTDGCTLVPDFNFSTCCEAHDRAYWQGGSCAERRQADQDLAQCIRAAGHPGLAPWYGAGVRIGGADIWPVPWRWGFGWPYGLSCQSVSPNPPAPP